MAEVALTLSGVAVAFGALRAVDGVDLSIPAGQRRAIIGPNGAGKTTLFNAITGVVPPTEGRVVFEGLTLPICRRTSARLWALPAHSRSPTCSRA